MGKNSLLGIVVCVLVVLPTHRAVGGATIEWRPVESTGAYLLEGNTIHIGAGATEVVLEIRIHGWGPMPGDPRLANYQVSVDSSGYSNLSGFSLGPKGWPSAPTEGAFVDTGRSDYPFGPFGQAFVSTPSLDYRWSGLTSTGVADAGAIAYGGTLILEVPPNATGEYVIGFLEGPIDTFLRDSNGANIPIVSMVPAVITMGPGRCCWEDDQGVSHCETGLDASECDAKPAPVSFAPGADCATCACPVCEANGDCDDGSACTIDRCGACGCTYELSYDDAHACCNPDSGHLTPLNDGDPCTLDVCVVETGAVLHSQAPVGLACDDGLACTVDDSCDDFAVCAGIPVDTLSCSADGDCPTNRCDPGLGSCRCIDAVPLRVDVADGIIPDGDPACFSFDDDVQVTVHMGAGTAPVVGAQFRLSYDPVCVRFESIGPCPGSMFHEIVLAQDDPIDGSLFYAATVDLQTPIGVLGPEPIACATFRKRNSCTDCSICLENAPNQEAVLTNELGEEVVLDLGGCTAEIRHAGSVDMNVPGSGTALGSLCVAAGGAISWDLPTASDGCGGPVGIVCSATNSAGHDVEALLESGGVFPTGTSTFSCSTSPNSCGAVAERSWQVTVDQNCSASAVAAESPLDRPKNRYVSFSPVLEDPTPVAYGIVLSASEPFANATGVFGWVGEPDVNSIAGIVGEPYYSATWPDVVHVTDCRIVPASSYEVSATHDGVLFAAPLRIETVPRPGRKFWGDCVGGFVDGAWSAPDGYVNMDDVVAGIQAFQERATAPHLSFVDVGAETPNRLVNFADVQLLVVGFLAQPFPFSDPAECP